MRVGVVGCGYWGSKHIRVLSDLPQVSAVVIIDGRPEIRASVGADHPRAHQRPDLTSAIDDVDAIVVATPPESHFDVAAQAIEAGKHVLVEKPLTTNTVDALRLVKMAGTAGVTLAAGHTFAYNDAVWKLAEIIQLGTLGRLHYLDAARLSLGLYRHDVNVLWDLAAHDIAIATLMMGMAPETVSAWGDRHTAGFREDVASLRMRFERHDVTATVRSSWLDPEKVRRTTAVGSEKMAIYDDANPDARIQVLDRGRRPQVGLGTTDPMEVNYRDAAVTVPEISFREPLHVQAVDFIRCCLTGARPVADGVAGLAVVAVLEASDLSLRENGAPVPIDLADLQLATTLAVA